IDVSGRRGGSCYVLRHARFGAVAIVAHSTKDTVIVGPALHPQVAIDLPDRVTSRILPVGATGVGETVVARANALPMIRKQEGETDESAAFGFATRDLSAVEGQIRERVAPESLGQKE